MKQYQVILRDQKILSKPKGTDTVPNFTLVIWASTAICMSKPADSKPHKKYIKTRNLTKTLFCLRVRIHRLILGRTWTSVVRHTLYNHMRTGSVLIHVCVFLITIWLEGTQNPKIRFTCCSGGISLTVICFLTFFNKASVFFFCRHFGKKKAFLNPTMKY